MCGLRSIYVVIITVVGDVMVALCMLIGPSVFIGIRDTVLSGVRKNLETAGQCCDKSSSNSESPPVSTTSLTIVTRQIVCRRYNTVSYRQVCNCHVFYLDF